MTCDARLIERHEYKYFIDANKVEMLRKAIQPFCQLDPYSERSPTRRYLIESHYYDTPELSLYWANTHEAVDRFKFRVRSYPGSGCDDVFVEIKRRINDVVKKTRHRMARSAWETLYRTGRICAPDELDPDERSALERFVFLSTAYRLRPVTVVRYDREAYFSRIDEYARITFDRRICSIPKPELGPSQSAATWRYQDNAEMQKTSSAKTLVELKFTSMTPRWMIDIVRQLGLMRRSFSKYGTAVRTWHSATENNNCFGRVAS